jgi:hypothetical protein
MKQISLNQKEQRLMPDRITLEVKLDVNADPTVGPYVTVIGNPNNANGQRVRWIEADDNTDSFQFAGLELDPVEFPNQKIHIEKNRITSGNLGSQQQDFEYVVWVRQGDKVYNSTDTSQGPAGGKAVIRNQ